MPKKLFLIVSLIMFAGYSQISGNDVKKEFFDNGKIKSEISYKDGKRDGAFKSYYQSGQLEAEGQYVKDLRNGHYKNYSEDGSLKGEGTFVDGTGTFHSYGKDKRLESEFIYEKGALNGPFKTYYPNGKVFYEGFYSKNSIEGLFKFYYENGAVMAASEFKANVPNGLTKDYYRNGKLKSERTFVNGEWSGPAKDYYESGKLAGEYFVKSNKIVGASKSFYENGALSAEGEYADNKLTGSNKGFYESGAIAYEMRYKDGLPNGKIRRLYPSGSLHLACEYSDGVLTESCKGYLESGEPANGRIKTLDPSGVVLLEYAYEAGVPHGPYKRYYANGILASEGAFENGKSVGVAKAYYESGKLFRTTYFSDGVLEGPFETYYESGKVRIRGNYKKWSPDGAVKEFTEAGDPILTNVYEGGELIDIQTYSPLTPFIPRSEKKGIDQRDSFRLMLEGQNISSEEAAKMEDKLKTDTNDLSARIKLYAFYQHQPFPHSLKLKEHVLWVIQNHPYDLVGIPPELLLSPGKDEEAFMEAKELWFKQVKVHQGNVAVLSNASDFINLSDRETSEQYEQLLKKAQSLEPYNPKWTVRLSHLYALRAKFDAAQGGKTLKSLRQLENALALNLSKQDAFYVLTDLPMVALEAGDSKKAEDYANQLLTMASQYENDGRYGDAIQAGNLVLGRLAIKAGNTESAKDYLLKAGKIPRLAQQDSVGPNMSLAKELLEKGEKSVVLEYFKLCSVFWMMGGDRLRKWSSEVEKGEVPDFGANLL